MYTHARCLAVVLSILAFDPRIIAVPAVHPLFDLASVESAPFPTDRFTVAEPKNITGLRVDLPMPDCDQQPSDCEDIAVINTLDGFNVQPRLSIPFSGQIDVHSVTSDTVLLLKLVCPHDDQACDEGPRPPKVGINQVVWDTLTNTLHVESDELLDQHARYALIVTPWCPRCFRSAGCSRASVPAVSADLGRRVQGRDARRRARRAESRYPGGSDCGRKRLHHTKRDRRAGEDPRSDQSRPGRRH